MQKWKQSIVLGASLLAFASSAAAVSNEQLSEIEKLKIEKAQLIATLAEISKDRSGWRTSFGQCIDQLGKTEAAESAKTAAAFSDELVKEIENAHKGYTLNAKGELVKKDK